MAIRCGPLFCCPAASGSRTHPQYVKRFGAICPAKSMAVPELLPYFKTHTSDRSASKLGFQCLVSEHAQSGQMRNLVSVETCAEMYTTDSEM